MFSYPLDLMIAAAVTASAVITRIYAAPLVAMSKADGSPVTAADQAAEAEILARLDATGIPILAEESVAAGIVPELDGQFFCVDPLDGTKEFLKRNGEFTVNIALIEAGLPVMGVIVVPVTGAVFVGGPQGAFETTLVAGQPGNWTPIHPLPTGPLRIMGSRSHGHAAMADLCAQLAVSRNVSVGSSLKFCLLARGDAQLYPRFTPTSEWDTAAGQAILTAAGGAVLTLDGEPLRYGKREQDFLNPFFVAAATAELARATSRKMAQILAQR